MGVVPVTMRIYVVKLGVAPVTMRVSLETRDVASGTLIVSLGIMVARKDGFFRFKGAFSPGTFRSSHTEQIDM